MAEKLTGRALYESFGGSKFSNKLGMMNLSLENDYIEFNLGPNKSGAFSVQVRQTVEGTLDVDLQKYDGRLFKMKILKSFTNLTTPEFFTTLEDNIGVKF